MYGLGFLGVLGGSGVALRESGAVSLFGSRTPLSIAACEPPDRPAECLKLDFLGLPG